VYRVGSNYYVFKQLIAIVLGLLAFVVAAKIPLNWWYRFVTPILIVAALATLLAIVMPVNQVILLTAGFVLVTFPLNQLNLLNLRFFCG